MKVGLGTVTNTLKFKGQDCPDCKKIDGKGCCATEQTDLKASHKDTEGKVLDVKG